MTDNVIRMYGNLRTGSAPEAVARDGECAETAQRLLNGGEK